MLNGLDPVPTLAVTDLSAARAWYEGTLGWEADPLPEGPDEMGVLYKVGNGRVMVYPSEFAGTNKATAVSFEVPADDFDGVIAELRAAGITFDTFEMPGGEWQDGVLAGYGMRSVWFHDPDGNIINVATYA
jgi:catechol 2,3-dioxygenase-like lactoylglutathione lyase family enzyme